jgi:hypothetical protein
MSNESAVYDDGFGILKERLYIIHDTHDEEMKLEIIVNKYSDCMTDRMMRYHEYRRHKII